MAKVSKPRKGERPKAPGKARRKGPAPASPLSSRAAPAETSAPSPAKSTVVSFETGYRLLVSRMRRVAHDVRNALNDVDLQAAYMAEYCSGLVNPEMDFPAEFERLRKSISITARTLLSHSGALNPGVIPSGQLMEEFKDVLKKVGEECAERGIGVSVALSDTLLRCETCRIFFLNIVSSIILGVGSDRNGRSDAGITGNVIYADQMLRLELVFSEQLDIGPERRARYLSFGEIRAFITGLGGSLTISPDAETQGQILELRLPDPQLGPCGYL
jgi:hypothetical protein